jgi:hypothetical protein
MKDHHPPIDNLEMCVMSWFRCYHSPVSSLPVRSCLGVKTDDERILRISQEPPS